LEACGGAGGIARRLILSVEAEADLDQIFSYDIEQWRVELANAYRELLDSIARFRACWNVPVKVRRSILRFPE
jgi:hypothetical protein